jgi:hypothetical protein
MENWTDFSRDDLNHIPLAVEKGWLPDFDYIDRMYHRTTPKNVPNHCVQFKKNNKTAWKVYKTTNNNIIIFWRIADLINGYYKNHRTYNTLEEIFDKE